MATIEIPPTATTDVASTPSPADISVTPIDVDVALWSPTQAIVTLAGELDAAGAPVVRQRIGELAERRVVDIAVDVGRVTFVDSIGIGALVGSSYRLRAAGGRLRLLHPSPSVQRLLDRTGWTRDQDGSSLPPVTPSTSPVT